MIRHLSLLSLALAACAGDAPSDDTDTTNDTDVDGASTLVGLWESDDGQAFLGRQIGEVQFLEIEAVGDHDAGFVTLYAEEEDSNALNCPREVWGLGADGTLVVSGQGGEGGGGTDLYLIDQPDPDTLIVTDPRGNAQTFVRTDAVDDDAQCGAVEIEEDTTFDVQDDGRSNLLWDGTALRLRPDAGGLVSLDMATGEVGEPVTYGGSYPYFQVMQGLDGWGHCACGGSEEIVRTSPGGAQVDLVDLADLVSDMGVDGAALDGTTLLVYGYSYADSQPHVVRIDAEAEPDLLVDDTPLAIGGQAIAQHGDDLLLISGQRILRVAENGYIDGTWQLPPELGTMWWRNLTSDGTSVYVGGTSESGGYRVVQLSLD